MKVFFVLISREIALTLKKSSGLINSILFFLVTASTVPFGLSPTAETLQAIGPAIIWICFILSTLLIVPNIFQNDALDGSLNKLLLLPARTETVVIAKIIAFTISIIIPVIFIVPFISLFFQLSAESIKTLLLSLVISAPTIASIATIGASLTIASKKTFGLVTIIVMPLYVPVLIFGVGMNIAHDNFETSILMLIAFFLIMMPLSVGSSSYLARDFAENH